MAETGNAAFIGLGVMGYPMAGHPKSNGWDVTVYNWTAAGETGARVPLTALVDQFYKHVQARGGNRFDTSSLMVLLTED